MKKILRDILIGLGVIVMRAKRAEDRCPSRQFQLPWRESDPSVADRFAPAPSG